MDEVRKTYGHEAVIPLVLEGTSDQVLTPPLRRFQAATIDLTTADARVWDKVAELIRDKLAQAPPERDTRLQSIKHPHSPHFVGREEKLNEMCEKLFAAPQPDLSRGAYPIILAGIGGAGKTTLARAYAEKLWRLYSMMFWVDCRAGLQSEFARLHDELFPGVPSAGMSEANKAARALLELKQRDPGRLRLLVIDNAESEDEATPWIPQTGNCHTIITARFSGWSLGMDRVSAVKVLDREPSRDLLLSRTGLKWDTLPPPEQIACDALAEKLGFLPLALEHAAAYITAQHDGSFGFASYLRVYEGAQRYYLSQQPSRGSTDYHESVYTTWRMTIDKLPAGARAMLRLSCFMAATPIPTALFVAGFDVLSERIAQFPETGAAIDAELPPEVQVREWRAALLQYSMIQANEDGDFSVHMLVQAVERLAIAEADRDDWLRQAIAAFMRYAPASAHKFEHWPAWKKLLPHGQLLWEHADARQISDEQTTFATSLANYKFAQGEYASAEVQYRRALDTCKRIHGPDHLDTLRARTGVALVRASQGDYAAAERLYRRALEGYERERGADDPETLRTMQSLGVLLRRTGDYASAEHFGRRVVVARQRVLGAEHRETLESMGALALTLWSKGEYAEAEELHRRALASEERVLGPEHPDTLMSVNNLALVLSSKGDNAAAEALFRRALKVRERVLGPEHPETLASMVGLAVVVAATGDNASAEALYRCALEAHERVMGKEHPHTLMTMNNLGMLLAGRGDYSSAEPLYRRVLEAHERVLGTDHPSTLMSVHNLARLLGSKGDYSEADPLYRRALAVRERVLGREHPETLTTIADLALLLSNKGDYAAAEPLSRRALEARQHVLGGEHPDTLVSMNNLAVVLQNAGNSASAEALYRGALEGLVRISARAGSRHPNLNLFMTNYLRILGINGYDQTQIDVRLDEMGEVFAMNRTSSQELRLD